MHLQLEKKDALEDHTENLQKSRKIVPKKKARSLARHSLSLLNQCRLLAVTFPLLMYLIMASFQEYLLCNFPMKWSLEDVFPFTFFFDLPPDPIKLSTSSAIFQSLNTSPSLSVGSQYYWTLGNTFITQPWGISVLYRSIFPIKRFLRCWCHSTQLVCRQAR